LLRRLVHSAKQVLVVTTTSHLGLLQNHHDQAENSPPRCNRPDGRVHSAGATQRHRVFCKKYLVCFANFLTWDSGTGRRSPGATVFSEQARSQESRRAGSHYSCCGYWRAAGRASQRIEGNRRLHQCDRRDGAASASAARYGGKDGRGQALRAMCIHHGCTARRSNGAAG
jgi:hypothetical protein